jgi:outer membrane protein
MRTIKKAFVLAVVMFVFGFSAYAADMTKIGVLDLQRILTSSTHGKNAQAEINKKGEELTADLKGKEKDLEELKSKLEREALVMSPEMRDEKEREFRIKLGDLQSLEKKYKKELQELNLKLVSKIQNDIFAIVAELGKKEGYLLIIEKREAGVIFAPDAIDISEKVAKLYNEKYEKEKR